MFVERALTLLLTPRPDEGITREVSERRSKVINIVNIMVDALLVNLDSPDATS